MDITKVIALIAQIKALVAELEAESEKEQAQIV